MYPDEYGPLVGGEVFGNSANREGCDTHADTPDERLTIGRIR